MGLIELGEIKFGIPGGHLAFNVEACFEVTCSIQSSIKRDHQDRSGFETFSAECHGDYRQKSSDGQKLLFEII